MTITLACTLGDPEGIGPEVVLRALTDLPWMRVILAGSAQAWQQQADRLDAPTRSAATIEAAVVMAPGAPICLESFTDHQQPGAAALDAIQAAEDWARSGLVDAMVTAPVDKSRVARHDVTFVGHTEFLAARAGVRHPQMLFVGPRPHVALHTTHMPLVTALTLIRCDSILASLVRLDELWSPRFGHRPCIGVAALNPHASEGGRFGTEESRILAPAMTLARARGVDARGPYPADSIFMQPDLDVVLSLYHDQGTILAKRAPWPTVNLTLGLPYIRTSPDHGTAFALAGTGQADPAPMRAAIELAVELAAAQ